MQSNPPPNLVQTDSDRHPDMFKTLDLLALNTDRGRVYFVLDGLCIYKGQDVPDRRFFYNSHSCPTNYVRVRAICVDGDMDPHGIFEYVRSVWLTKEFEAAAGDEYAESSPLLAIFPELRAD